MSFVLVLSVVEGGCSPMRTKLMGTSVRNRLKLNDNKIHFRTN